jgi:chorismate mutase
VTEADPAATLSGLRARLAGIDQSLLDLLRLRIECCVEVARVRRDSGMPVAQPEQIAVIRRRAADYGASHGLDQDFLRRFSDLVIGETCRVEEQAVGRLQAD